MSNSRQLEAYVSQGNLSVQGWLEPIAIRMLLACAAVQEKLKISGPVCEIGVHHGRLLILLQLLTTGSERTVGYDLFEWQDQNIDRSGSGDAARVKSNLIAHGCDTSRTTAIRANSLQLSAEKVITDCQGRPRLFSVDGGHTAEITKHDLALAEASLCRAGVVIVDDFFNQNWPEVAVGVCAHLASGSCGLIPFGIGGNKFLFTNDTAAATLYREALLALPELPNKEAEVMGHGVVIISAPYRRVIDSARQFSNDLRKALRAKFGLILKSASRQSTRR